MGGKAPTAAVVAACILAEIAQLSPTAEARDGRQAILEDHRDTFPSVDHRPIASHFRSHFEKSATLSEPDEDDVVVFWSINSHRGEIEFGVLARGQGYVALGLSSKLSMKGLDIAVISMDAERSRFQVGDYFATDFARPVLDPEHLQNWELLEAQRNGTHTVARLVRPLTTCDDDNDHDVGQTPMTLAYALGETDELAYHATRGGKTVSFFLDELLEEPPAVSDDLVFNASTWSHAEVKDSTQIYAVDLFSLDDYWEYTVPTSQVTTYTCFKYNITQQIGGGAVYWEGTDPVVSNTLVHHAVVSSCPEDVYRSFPDTQEECFIMPSECHPVAGFTAGSPYSGTPDNVAGRFGGDECATGGAGEGCRRLFIMQVHFENRDLMPGVSAGFSLRFFIQNEAPKQEIGHLVTSVPFNGIQIPAESLATANGECPSICTANMLPEDGIDILRVVLHAHERATKVTLRHVRDGRELPVLAEDRNFDFNQPALINSRRRLMPGDRLLLACEYDSSGFGPNQTVGGWALRDEMCLAYLSVYPPIQRSVCGVSPSLPELAYCGSNTDDLSTDGDGENWSVDDTFRVVPEDDINSNFQPLDPELELCYRSAYGAVPDPFSWIVWSIPFALMMLAITALFYLSGCVLRRFSAPYKELSISNQQNVRVYIVSIVVLTVALILTAAYGSELMSGMQSVIDTTGKAGSLGPRRDATLASVGMTLVGLVMLFELLTKVNINASLAAHHIATVLLISLAHYGFYATLDSGYAQIGIILTLYATTEQPVYLALLLKRLAPAKYAHSIPRCFYFAAGYTWLTKTAIFAGSVAWFWSIGFTPEQDFQWRPPTPVLDDVMRILYPTLVALLYTVQLHQVWVLFCIARGESRKLSGRTNSSKPTKVVATLTDSTVAAHKSTISEPMALHRALSLPMTEAVIQLEI